MICVGSPQVTSTFYTDVAPGTTNKPKCEIKYNLHTASVLGNSIVPSAVWNVYLKLNRHTRKTSNVPIRCLSEIC